MVCFADLGSKKVSYFLDILIQDRPMCIGGSLLCLEKTLTYRHARAWTSEMACTPFGLRRWSVGSVQRAHWKFFSVFLPISILALNFRKNLSEQWIYQDSLIVNSNFNFQAIFPNLPKTKKCSTVLAWIAGNFFELYPFCDHISAYGKI